MAKIKICKEPGCHNAQTTSGYCRLHYLKNWKKIKHKQQRKSADRLNRYVESIVKQHPDHYLEVIKEDLRSKNFEKLVEDRYREELDELYHIFDDKTYEEDIEQLIKDLKVEDDF